MKCPHPGCDAVESSVLATRGDRRRRECSLGHRFVTQEIYREEIDRLRALETLLMQMVETLEAPGRPPGVDIDLTTRPANL